MRKYSIEPVFLMKVNEKFAIIELQDTNKRINVYEYKNVRFDIFLKPSKVWDRRKRFCIAGKVMKKKSRVCAGRRVDSRIFAFPECPF